MEVFAHREVLKHLLVVGHEAPCQDAYLLIEGDLVNTAGQVGAMRVDHILEVLAQTGVQWLQIDLSLDDLEQTIELIDGQVFYDGLRHGHDLFLCGCPRKGLVDEVGVDFLQRMVPSVDKVTQVVDRGRLILNQDQDQVQRQGRQRLPVSRLVYSADVRDTVASTVVADDIVDERDEEVFDVFASPVRQVRAERVENDEVLVRCVKQRLRQQSDHQAHQCDPVAVILRLVVVSCLHDGDA